MIKKLALIGCGYWGKNYVKTLLSMNASLKYVCDTSEPSIAIPEGSIFTKNIEEILNDSEIDKIIVAVPTAHIFEVVKKCLFAGKNVLMEKPMTKSSTKAKELKKMADEKNLILMVGHIFDYHPALKKLKELINQGEIGKVLYAYSIRAAPGPVRNSSGTNALWDLAPHDLSIFLNLFGDFTGELNAFGSDFIEKDVLDSVTFSMKFKEVFAEAHLRWIDAEKNRKLTVIGDKKIAVFDDLAKDKLKIYTTFVDFNEKGKVVEKGVTVPELENNSPLENQCRHFIECVENNTVPISNAEEGIKVVELIEKIESKIRSQNESSI